MEEPGAGDGPVAFDGGGRGIDDGGGFLDGKTAEVAKFDDAGAVGVEGGEFVEGAVEGDHVEVGIDGEGDGIEIDGNGAIPTLLGIAGAGVIEEDTPHGPGGGAEEVSAVGPSGAGLIDEAEVGFVDEGGAAEGMSAAFLQKEDASDPAEFVIDERDHGFEGFGVAFGPTVEESGDSGLGRRLRHGGYGSAGGHDSLAG